MIDSDTRKLVVNALPLAMARALLSYESFLEHHELKQQVITKTLKQKLETDEDNQPQDNKTTVKSDAAADFQAHHAACKMAIAHIELLFKLAKFVGEEDQSDQRNMNLKQVMATAQEALKQNRAQMNEEPVDDN